MIPRIRNDFNTEILAQSGIKPTDTAQITNDISVYAFMTIVVLLLIFLIIINIVNINR